MHIMEPLPPTPTPPKAAARDEIVRSLPIAPVANVAPRVIASAPTPSKPPMMVTPSATVRKVQFFTPLAASAAQHSASAPDLCWKTPTNVQLGSDNLVRSIKPSAWGSSTKENAAHDGSTRTRTPSKVVTREALVELLLTPHTQSGGGRLGKTRARHLSSSASTTGVLETSSEAQSASRSEFALGSSNKPRTLSSIELGTTPFGMPRCEPPAPLPPPSAELAAAAATTPAQQAAASGDYVAVWEAQQQAASKRDPLRRWKRAGQVTRVRPRQDKITKLLEADRASALEYLELRSSFGAFAISLHSED